MRLFNIFTFSRHGPLTENDVALLLVFCKHDGKDLSTDYLSERAFGTEITDGGAAVTKHIYILRDKLHGSGYTITEKRGVYDGRFTGMEYTFERGNPASNKKARTKK